MARSVKKAPTARDIHKRQREYVARIEQEGFDYGLTVAGAFVRSIRDLGYRNAATAIDEIVDNSIEAGAANVRIVFGYTKKSEAKPTSLAIVDDGNGMVPEMIRAAVVWGGTDREGSSALFGRYGYGLPSASVSQGQCFTVYSRTGTGAFHSVRLDVSEIESYMENGRVVVPKASTDDLPKWLTDTYADDQDGVLAKARTIVVWDKLDRLTWKTTAALETQLLQHLGLVYRNFLRQTVITVNGKKVEPIDPLFTTPGHRFYDVDDDRAEALPPLTVKLPIEGVSPDPEVTLRISWMPFTFMSKDKTRGAIGKNGNARFAIRKENHGFAVCRNGRQIDVVTRNPLTTFVNNDRYIGLELNFPAELDGEFGLTTSKQQITISQRTWERLREAGLQRILEDLRRRVRESRDDHNVAVEDDPTIPRRSESVMTRLDGYTRHKPASSDQLEEAERNLERAAAQIARQTGLDLETIKAQETALTEQKPFKVAFESQPGAGAFFRCEQRGGQLILWINRAHKFYGDVYALVRGEEGARIRAGLELLLFAIGKGELDAGPEVRAMYMAERFEWSKSLGISLTLLADQQDIIDEDNDAYATAAA